MGIALLGGGKFYGWVVLATAALVYFFADGVLLVHLGVFLPFICKEFNWSRGAVSGAYAIVLSVVGLSGPFVGMFIGKYGPRRAIIIGNLFGGLGMLLLAFHSHLWQFYVGYGFFIGLGFGLGGLIATTTISNNWFVRRGPLTLGIISASGSIGGLVMAPLIMAMIGQVGWRSTYMILSALVFLFAVIVPGFLIRNRPEELGQIPDGVAASELSQKVSDSSPKKVYTTAVDFTLREAIRTKALWLLVVFFAAIVFAESLLVAHQVAFLVDMGIGAEMAATALGLLSGASIVGRLGMGFLGVKYRMQRLIFVPIVFMTVGTALILVTSSTRSLPMVFIYTMVFGIGWGGSLIALLSLLTAYFGRGEYAKILGIIMPFAIIIGSTGAPFAGVIYDVTKSYTLSFTIVIFVLLLGLVCLILLRPPVHPSLRESLVKT